MIYRRFADLVLACHALVVVFFMCGGLLSWRYPWVAVLHVPLAAWVTTIFLVDVPCPLTPLEKHWRQLGGGAGYEGGFIEHYVTATLYPHGLTRGVQLLLGRQPLRLREIRSKDGRDDRLVGGPKRAGKILLEHAAAGGG